MRPRPHDAMDSRKSTARHRFGRCCSRESVRVLCAAAACAAQLALGAPDASAKPPAPRAGAIPVEIEQIVESSGDRLHSDDLELDLAGARVRFTGEVEKVGRTAGGESYVVLSDGGDELTLRLPGPLDAPEKLEATEEWEIIGRLDRPVQIEGERAIAVGPDILVKTPGLVGEERPDDVIVRVAGAESFSAPSVEPWEEEKPLYRVDIEKQGTLSRDFVLPGPTAFAKAERGGKTLYDYQQVMRAADGRTSSIRCVFRLENGHLRNTSYGEVELAADGSRTKQSWVDFEKETFHDTWSARRKPFPPNVYEARCLSLAISGFPIGEQSVVRFFVWGGRGMPLPVYAYVDGEETLQTRGRAEKAQRIRVGLDVRRAAREIDLPENWKQGAEAVGESWYSGDTLYWIAADPPRTLLRFEGPLGPPGSPEAVIERVR